MHIITDGLNSVCAIRFSILFGSDSQIEKLKLLQKNFFNEKRKKVLALLYPHSLKGTTHPIFLLPVFESPFILPVIFKFLSKKVQYVIHTSKNKTKLNFCILVTLMLFCVTFFIYLINKPIILCRD